MEFSCVGSWCYDQYIRRFGVNRSGFSCFLLREESVQQFASVLVARLRDRGY